MLGWLNVKMIVCEGVQDVKVIEQITLKSSKITTSYARQLSGTSYFLRDSNVKFS